jgi:hypothetical protein
MNKEVTPHEPALLQKVRSYGYKTFDSADYDLNIIGVRNVINPEIDRFDDAIHIIYKEKNNWVNEWGAATTDPGRYYLEKEDYRQDGVAVMVHPQQCRGAYRIDYHNKRNRTKRYFCLRQHRPVRIWRDNNKTSRADYTGAVYTGVYYLNIHRSSKHKGGSKYVYNWSAGCQVWQDPSDFDRFMELCRLQVTNTGYTSFTYTLITNE